MNLRVASSSQAQSCLIPWGSRENVAEKWASRERRRMPSALARARRRRAKSDDSIRRCSCLYDVADPKTGEVSESS